MSYRATVGSLVSYLFISWTPELTSAVFHCQAPWRRTRFERLAVDHKQISQSCEVISMHLEDIISKAIQKQVGACIAEVDYPYL